MKTSRSWFRHFTWVAAVVLLFYASGVSAQQPTVDITTGTATLNPPPVFQQNADGEWLIDIYVEIKGSFSTSTLTIQGAAGFETPIARIRIRR